VTSASIATPACLRRENTNRLVSLWGLMNQFNAPYMLTGVQQLGASRIKLETIILAGGGATQLPDQQNKALREEIAWMKDQCENAGFIDSVHKIKLSLAAMAEGSVQDVSSLKTELRNIEESILVESYKFKFLQVTKARSSYVDHPALLGNAVATAFPSSIPDMKEAGNCLAAECNTAAVFHLMRVVEWGLRALCADVGLIRLRSKTKAGKVRYTPISFTDWEHMLNQLQGRVDSKVNRIRRGKLKQTAQEFYYPALQDIRSIRDAWRNHVMHTRRDYGTEEANAVLAHVQRLMATLASRVSE